MNLYFALQIFAHLKAIIFRPINLGENEISLRCGIIGGAKIKYESVEKVEIFSRPFVKEKGAINLTAAAKITQPNIKITLCETKIFNGFYGVEKKFKTICLAVDEAEKFRLRVENKLTIIG